MDDMEMDAAAEALQEIEKILQMHWMRKPEAKQEPAAEVSVEIDAAPVEEESYAEEETPFDAESVVAEEVGEDAPISIMDFGTRRKPQARPSAPPPAAPPMQEEPVKRGRGRPKKVR